MSCLYNSKYEIYRGIFYFLIFALNHRSWVSTIGVEGSKNDVDHIVLGEYAKQVFHDISCRTTF